MARHHLNQVAQLRLREVHTPGAALHREKRRGQDGLHQPSPTHPRYAIPVLAYSPPRFFHVHTPVVTGCKPDKTGVRVCDPTKPTAQKKEGIDDEAGLQTRPNVALTNALGRCRMKPNVAHTNTFKKAQVPTAGRRATMAHGFPLSASALGYLTIACSNLSKFCGMVPVNHSATNGLALSTRPSPISATAT